MRRVGYLFNKLIDKEFIKNTIQKATKHKTKRRQVRKVLNNLDLYTDLIHDMIRENKIELKPTRTKEIRERGKIRKITISPFYPNQILDYMLVEVIKPIVRKSMYQYCVGNVDKRGIMYGKKVVERAMKKYKYFIKLDIRHFYQNVNTNALIDMMRKDIKDERFIEFASQIIDKNELPIGCYYSQWLSNYYLTELDHLIKEKWHIPFYIRYVDDMVLGGNNKKVLFKGYYQIKKYLINLNLELKYNPTPRKKIDFLGFSFNRTETRLRKKIFTRLKKTLKKVKTHLCFSLVKRLVSFFSWIKNIKSGYNYYINKIMPIIRLGKLKRIVSQGAI